MTDYHPLIARAVDGLDKSTGEARRTLYERARTALVAQLRAVEPALSESEITKERLALEDAIRKVEAEAARKSRTEPRPAAPPRRERASPPADVARTEARPGGGTHAKSAADAGEADGPRQAHEPTARERLLSARSSVPSRESMKGFRDGANEGRGRGGATAKATQFTRDTRDSFGLVSSHPLPSDEEAVGSSLHDGFQPQLDAEELISSSYSSRQKRSRELVEEQPIEHPAMPQSAQQPPHITTLPETTHEPPRPARSYRGLIKLLVVLILVSGAAATISWQWSSLTGLYQILTKHGPRQPSQTTRETPSAQPKFSGRVPQEQNAGQAPGTAPGSQTAPAVAQRVVLYEEDPNDPQGRRFVGSAIWRTETVSPGPGLAPELAVRADVEIPERRMTMTWSLRRNTDKALPASHTIEIMFNLPADFPGGGVANVPGILMKQSEQARGTPLAGLAVKVTNGFFLIGLSAVDADLQRNVQLLKERPWFDIPVVYANGGRAILAMEKGPPGDRAFAEAFAAWEKK
ncbi:MAG: hypothetical protein ABSF87_02795 [Xanthobacteraceae bacterium]|jgi:hypothetical protein